MAVSVSTTAWNKGYLVSASGTIAEVNSEMVTGTASYCKLKSRDYFMGYGGTTAGNCVAIWYYKA
jgi:hypothetical protein